ncbi:MAG: 1-deoxy-D-xylulose-5-phosphate synthase [Gammaproteobacteria bacterium]|nr:MAG: 1-deoxy-D-xylulose-5-phosphate synthase [Gammaproteobacteria bacterium]
MLLDKINSPADLKKLDDEEIQILSDEIRQFLIKSVAKTGGHLAASLGVVELTLALHWVFDAPADKIVWDVGHQGYTHKIITGRKKEFKTLRQKNGISGFIHPDESPYDSFGVGHASTSISIAQGIASAFALNNKNNQAIAVIGDGAMGGGMAFEALNDAGARDTNLLVILNDNNMSISKNVGGLSKHLTKILSGKLYTSARESSKNIFNKIPKIWELARKTEEHLKGWVIPGIFFEELGFNYFGPIDGHDYKNLKKVLSNLKNIKGPKILHVATTKGKGFVPAEKDPCGFHGVYPFDVNTGEPLSNKKQTTFTDIFAKWLVNSARLDKKLIAITPAMCEGSGLTEFKEQNPDRYFDVGIAEQHSITYAAGMAKSGFKPVVAIYSTFLQRAYDQLIHDVALQDANVLFAIDRAGVVGADGATHTGAFDIAFLLPIPNIVIMAPSDGNELYQMLNAGFEHPHPVAIRYPRDKISDKLIISDKKIKIGMAKIVNDGGDEIVIFCFGSLLSQALIVAKNLNATLVDMRFIKPLDEKIILKLAKINQHIITIEEGAIIGGAGSYVCQFLQKNQIIKPVLSLGLEDRYCEHATRDEVLVDLKLDSDSIESQIKYFIQKTL